MTNKPFWGALSLTATLIAVNLFSACNSDSDLDSYTYTSNGSTAVTAFSLVANSKILYHLDSVYFSIDLDDARIFNASPLPAGTDVSKLLVTISTDNCSKVELNFKSRWGNDTTVNFLVNNADSINFADGPVDLFVVSYDGQNLRHYSIEVNVFDYNPDSIAWRQTNGLFPSALSDVKQSKTVKGSGAFYTLSCNGSDYQLQTTSQLYDAVWTVVPDFSLNDIQGMPLVETFNIGENDTWYLLDDDSTLYSSTDSGRSWTATEVSMDWILGVYGDKVLGCRVNGGKPYTVVYPGGVETVQNNDFPVKLTSNMEVYNTKWEVNPLAVISGGQTVSGSYSGDTWAFDGVKWAKISSASLEPAAGRSLVKYAIVVTDSVNWRSSYIPALYAIGGEKADGTMVDKAYYSLDMGVNWIKAPDAYQINTAMPGLKGASAIVDNCVLRVESRAVAPITEWDCPYIHIIGGTASDGGFNTQLWQGVLLRYTFKPLQ